MKLVIITLLSIITFSTFAQTNTYTALTKSIGKTKETCVIPNQFCDGQSHFSVSHTPTNQVWFSVNQTNHMISFSNSAVVVSYLSSFGRSGCSNGIITWKDISPSEQYVFDVFWPTNQVVPTNVLVGLTAVGFSPSTNTP